MLFNLSHFPGAAESEGLPWVLGNKGTCPISTGNRGTKAKYDRGQGNEKRFREHGSNVTVTYLATFSLYQRSQRFFQSVCMELRQRLNWGTSMSSDEFTLGD